MGALRAASATACGWPPGFGSWHGVAHSSQARSAANIAPVLRLSRCGRRPWRRWLRRQPSGKVNIKVNPTAEAAPSSRRLTALPRPRPNPAALAVPGSQSRGSLLVPVLAISAPCGPHRGPPCLTACLAGLASPRPADASPSHSKLRNGSRRVKIRFNRKRLMAAADAAAMMWGRQTGKSERGGSVSAGKSARRGVGVKTLLSWRKA